MVGGRSVFFFLSSNICRLSGWKMFEAWREHSCLSSSDSESKDSVSGKILKFFIHL